MKRPLVQILMVVANGLKLMHRAWKDSFSLKLIHDYFVFLSLLCLCCTLLSFFSFVKSSEIEGKIESVINDKNPNGGEMMAFVILSIYSSCKQNLETCFNAKAEILKHCYQQ